MAKKLINNFPFESYTKESFDEVEMKERSHQFHQWMDKRRSLNK
jgi:iodotyrosine deiodinase